MNFNHVYKALKKASLEEARNIFSRNEKLADTLTSWNWFQCIWVNPPLIQLCPQSVLDCFSSSFWSSLILEYPDEMLRYCDFETFDSLAWTLVAWRLGPRVEKQFEEWLNRDPNNTLRADDWSTILIAHPEYVKFCDITSLPDWIINAIVTEQPALAYLQLVLI